MKPKKRKKRRPWPAKHRQHLALKCREGKPWEKSTGPRTGEGKNAIRYNNWQHGLESAGINNVRRVLRLQRSFMKIALARHRHQNMVD